MYDRTWQTYRARFLAINKGCYACPEPAVVVDHLVPHKGDEKLFKKTDNHIPLCIKCHNTVTTLFDRDYKIGSSIVPKVEWLNRKRKIVIDDWAPKKVKVLERYG